MITVVHCINSVSSAGGGPSFVLKELLDNVSAAQHEVFSLEDDQRPVLSPGGTIRLFPRSGPFALSYSPSFERALRRRLRELPQAIIHVHGAWSAQTFSVNRIRRENPQVRVIVSPHGMLSPTALERKSLSKRLLARFCEKPLFTRAEQIHALTPREALDIQACFGSHLPIEIIPNLYRFTLNKSTMTSIWRERAQIPKTLVYLGRIHPTKGVFELLAACRERLQSRGELGARVLIAGFGDDESVQRLRLQLEGLEPHVTYVGPVYDKDKQALLQNAHGMILPSKTEGFPVSLLEGSAAALALFVTRQCNFNWVADVHPRCQEEYGAEGIRALLDAFCSLETSELRSIGMQTYLNAQQQFDASVVAHQWARVYASLHTS